MKKCAGLIVATAVVAGLVLLPGCGSAPVAPHSERGDAAGPVAQVMPTTGPANADEIVAIANGIPITRGQLEKPLIESYGLQVLLNMVELELAKQQLARAGMVMTPDEIQQEHDRTLGELFANASKSDYPQLLEQFLHQKNVSRDEFDMLIDTNAYLRKLATPQLAGRLTDEQVHTAFSQLYGENRVVRDIELGNVVDAAKAKQFIAGGEPFEHVAQRMSQNRNTAALGGELPPFSAQSPNVPQVIRDQAFALKLDEVSESLAIGETTHVIKLVQIIPPKIVKYEDVKDSVREQIGEQWIQLAIKNFRSQLAEVALQTMKIRDPVLNAQWMDRLQQRSSKIRDRDSAMAELNRERKNATTNPTTTPGAGPAAQPLPERPPATMPGAVAPGGPAASTTNP